MENGGKRSKERGRGKGLIPVCRGLFHSLSFFLPRFGMPSDPFPSSPTTLSISIPRLLLWWSGNYEEVEEKRRREACGRNFLLLPFHIKAIYRKRCVGKRKGGGSRRSNSGAQKVILVASPFEWPGLELGRT